MTLDQLPIPTESIAKISHHANDHAYEHGHAPTFKKDGHLNPLSYAISHSWKAAAWGAMGLLAFTGVLKAGLMLGEFLIPSSIVMAAGIGIGLAGVAWYGASAFYKAYGVAQTHNENLTKDLDDQLQSHVKEHHKDKTRGQELPRRTIASAGVLPTTIGLPEHEPHAEAHTHRETPRHVKKILEEGKRSLSPKEMAQRIHEQRTAATEASL